MLKTLIIHFWVLLTAVSLSDVCAGQVLRVRRIVMLSDSMRPVVKSMHGRMYDSSVVAGICRERVMKGACRGFPFATATVDSAVVIPGRGVVDVFCHYSPMNRYLVDNIYVIGDARLARHYIYNVTGIFPGEIYRENRVMAASRRIADDGVAEVAHGTEVEFHPEGADVYLYLKRHRQNSLHAGLVLNRDDVDGKYFVTGDALADLRNNFGHGERFYLAWNGYARRSQMLDFQYHWPYVFQWPVTPGLSLSMDKTDSLCLSLRMKAGVSVPVTPDFGLTAVADLRRLTSSSDYVGESTTRLFGVGFSYRWIYGDDGRLKATAEILGGTRENGGESGAVADFTAVVESVVPLGSVLRIESLAGAGRIYGGGGVDVHECHPIGGAGSLRGFERNEIRATAYVTACNTVRLMLSDAFSVQMFYDQAFYKCEASGLGLKDYPSGVGFGIGLRKNAVNLDIGWAIGSEHGKMRPMNNLKTLIIMQIAF